MEAQTTAHSVIQTEVQSVVKSEAQSVVKTADIYKPNETKPNKTEKKESKKESFGEIIASFSFCNDVKEEIGEYLKMRAMKKNIPTDYALKLVLVKLTPHTKEEQLAMLRASITNGWTDVYEPKKEEQRKDYDTVDKQYKLKEWI